MTEQAVATAIVEAQGITRDFKGGSGIVHALRGIDLRHFAGRVCRAARTFWFGQNHAAQHFDRPGQSDQRQRPVLGRELAKMSESERAHLRSHNVGMMFQNAHLFPSLTAQENVEIPLRLMRMDPAERTKKAFDALWNAFTWGRARIIAAWNCRGASSSAWHWRARWFTSRSLSSPTNQRVIWTR